MNALSRGRGRVAGIAAIVIVAITGLAVSGAFAGKKLKTKTQSTTLSPATGGNIDEETLTPKCKKGTKAVSGGWFGEIEISGGSADKLALPSVNRRDGGRKWTGTAINLTTVDTADYEVYAYCRAQKKVKSRTDTTAAPAASGGNFTKVRATATCPRGTKIVSGGFEAPTDLTPPDQTLLFVTESHRDSAREWTVAGGNAAGKAGELTAQANCSKRKLKERSAELAFPSADPAFVEVDAKCKRSQRVISGGFSSPDLASNQIAIVTASRKQGKRTWQVLAYGQDTTLTAYAYCEKKKKK